MSLKSNCLTLFFFLLTLFCCENNVPAQNKDEDIIRVETRVVFVDTLVRDKKTGAPVKNLAAENFQLLDDGKPRKLSHFSREGLSRRPLALVLVLNLHSSGILFLEKTEVMESIISALSKLQPEDEVAITQTWYEPEAGADPYSFQIKSKTVQDLTRDRAKTFAALRSVQEFARHNLPQVESLFLFKGTVKSAGKDAIIGGGTIGASAPPIGTTDAPDYKRILDNTALLAEQHPESQFQIVEVTDDLDSEGFGKTTKTARRLIASNATVNGLIMKRNLMDKAINVFGSIISPLMGERFHTISYFAKQTGGETAVVGRPEEFIAAVDRIISGIAARYSLGFLLEENAPDDNRMHKLEVKVKARDEHGKKREVTVNARRGYYQKQISEQNKK
jgi:VWFA-related protein